MFTFTNDCLIGISEIDAEHKKLFELIAHIDTALKSNDDPVANAMTLINELKQYKFNCLNSSFDVAHYFIFHCPFG